MKSALRGVLFAALLVSVALAQKNVSPQSGAPQPPTTRPAAVVPTPDAAMKDVRIELALFGSGTHLADVTDRVVELLRTQPQGFTARADWLKVDPAPGKNKSLLIRYRYHDQERTFMITGGNRAALAELVEDAPPLAASATEQRPR